METRTFVLSAIQYFTLKATELRFITPSFRVNSQQHFGQKKRTLQNLVVLSVICLSKLVAAVEDSHEESIAALITNGSERALQIGDSCRDNCSSLIENSFCNQTSNLCHCKESHPIVIRGVICAQPRSLHETCTYEQQCYNNDVNSYCARLDDEAHSVCTCKSGFRSQKEHNIPIKYICTIDSGGSLTPINVPTIVGLGIGLTILSFLLCFMFKLFGRTRRERSRGFSTTNAPPTIVLEGEQTLDIEKQLYKPDDGSLNALLPSPSSGSANLKRNASGNALVSSSNSRRGSGNNNSNNTASGAPSRRSSENLGSGTTSRRASNGLPGRDSNTAPSSGVLSRRSSGNTSFGNHSRNASLISRHGILIPADLVNALKELESGEGEIEQRLTIIPNPRAKRRGSMASYAFPELHSRAAKNKQEPENLLILTRTRTDRHGRRHSVAVPLIPPPDGEKFEGGYHVERNPITGGATLVPPEATFTRGRSCSERRKSTRDPSPARRVNTTKDRRSPYLQQPGNKQPAAAKMDLLSTSPRLLTSHPHAWPTRSSSARCRYQKAQGLPTIGEGNLSQNGNESRVSKMRSQSFQIRRRPGASSGKIVHQVPSGSSDSQRRHSYQSGAVGQIGKDMDRLKVSAEGAAGGVRPSVSPRGSKKRRPSSARRSSKSGFLHFLDLAIAN